jgi:Helix-turn-helix domain
MLLSKALSPLSAISRTSVPKTLEWHSHLHDELCLISDGILNVGHAGNKVCPEPGTLFLFTEAEAHGLSNSGNAIVRVWSLEFRVSTELRIELRDLFECSAERRVLKLSADQQQRFCNTCQKIAFENGVAGPLHATAASALLALQLIDVARWFSADSGIDLVEAREKVDLQCFELWKEIHRHAFLSTSHGPILFNLNPAYDSIRHRFRKLFGISPRDMLVRLRMDRAKELLLTSDLSVKEIAFEVGYVWHQDFTRAFTKCAGMSPSQWRMCGSEVDVSP